MLISDSPPINQTQPNAASMPIVQYVNRKVFNEFEPSKEPIAV